MTEEEGDEPAGPLRKQPDRLDVWFRWIASLAMAALIGLCLVEIMQTEPTGNTSAAHYHRHVIG